ncbi:MAG: cytochrome c, partial [Actinobacteria bacterium]|nr:cytochrome c [Actinomycetota bacterium]
MTDDVDLEAELGFEPAVSATGADVSDTSPVRRRPRRKRGWRTRLAGGLVLLVALVSMGALYGAFAGSSNANSSADDQAQIARGQQIYQTTCITCHGANLQGVTDRGVSLIGVGSAATYFQVSTGRMPATGQDAEQPRKTAKYNEA